MHARAEGRRFPVLDGGESIVFDAPPAKRRTIPVPRFGAFPC